MAILLVFLLLALIAAILFLIQNKSVSADLEKTPVCFSGKCFDAEIASSFSARMKGLMNRQDLVDDAGMLFVFPNEGEYAFWMKNTFIPLDIIWIGKNKEIVYMAENVQPCKSLICPSVSPGKPALYVLELNAGKAGEAGLKEGDKAEFELR